MIPVVLSGGSGTRLWPVSRAACPKQFVEIFDESLLAKTFRRLAPLGSPWVVAVESQRFLTLRVMRELGVPAEQALLEPLGRNTAAAVGLICQVLAARGLGDEVVGIFPADHLIADEAELAAVVALAERCARAGQVVTLGIEPTYPATGYGYLETAAGEPFLAGASHRALRTQAFREKPDAATAASFLARGGFYWNAGMFVFEVATMCRHFARLMPALWAGLGKLSADHGNLAEVYAALPAQSFDYGIMEHLAEQVVIPCQLGWSDVGSWDEVARLGAPAGEVVEVEGDGNFVFPHDGRVYGLLGVSDLLVIDTADALLIARKGASQGVKQLVDQLAERGRSEAREHVYEHRPWGSFEVLRDSAQFKSKILRVAPGQQLSYQSHRFRSEHWVILRGAPEIVLDGEVLRPQPGEAVFIPQGARHRIRNPGEEPVEIVEVQVGSYFGEDDIVRYEDDYDRV